MYLKQPPFYLYQLLMFDILVVIPEVVSNFVNIHDSCGKIDYKIQIYFHVLVISREKKKTNKI